MNILLWIIQIALAFFAGAGGSWKLFNQAQLPPTITALSSGAWSCLGALELVCAAGLILPAATKIVPVATPIAASVLAVEGLGLVALYAHYDTRFVASNPMVYALFQVALASFVAYGRFVLEPI